MVSNYKMLKTAAFTFLLICNFQSAACAADAVTSLPLLALEPPATPVSASPISASPWSGFYVGSEVFAISGSGKGGMKGGVGGAADFGYNHEFSNNIVIGVEGSLGYMPSLFRYSRYSGFDVGTTNIKIGYDMGRVMPYVTIGVLLAKPHSSLGAGFTGASDAVNGLFSGPADLKAAGTIGAGVDYAITDKLTVGVSVSATKTPGGFSSGFIAP